MKQKLYLDTSVIGGVLDDEFTQWSVALFERIKKGDFKVLLSNITQEELVDAPAKVREVIEQLDKTSIEFLKLNDEVTELAHEYIAEKVVGKTSLSDCLHIALATINKADFLVSWNFKHIVNIQRIRGYNSINIKNGYKALEIRSPREFVKDED
jgi:predicted nucleic acid-binding protein